jgi:hypothetical protein
VTAGGTAPISYQWRKNGMNIGGATSPTLLISPANQSDEGNYSCFVSNAFGNATSNSAALTVLSNAECNDGVFCDGTEICMSGACVDGAPACAEACNEATDLCQPFGTMSCDLASSGAVPGGQATVSLFLSQVLDLHGYQAKISIVRTSGTGTVSFNCPDGIQIDISRSDFAFFGQNPFNAFDCDNGRMASAIFGAVEVPVAQKYIGEYLLDVSGDATVGSTFEITIEPEAEDTSFLRDSNQQAIPFDIGAACVLTIVACSVYGDVAQPQDGIVNIDDIICVLNGFGNFSLCPLGDLAPCFGNGIIDLNDILGVLAAFGGADPCCG